MEIEDGLPPPRKRQRRDGDDEVALAMGVSLSMCTAVIVTVFASVCIIVVYVQPGRLLFPIAGSHSSNFVPPPPGPTKGLQAMVSTDAFACSEVGAQAIIDGGNTIDAAIAAALCLGVVHPHSSGIGGGGFALVRQANGADAVIDFRETAPAASTVDMMGGDPQASLIGGLAVAVPGEVRGLHELHQHGALLPWHQLVAPAKKLAEEGFAVDDALGTVLDDMSDFILGDPEFAAVFSRDGKVLAKGQRCVNTELANSLAMIASDPESFYTGTFAEGLAAKVAGAGGVMTAGDVTNYSVVLREPIEGFFHGRKVLTAGPPASGGPVAVHMLNILEGFEMAGKRNGLNTHRIVEAMKFGYAERSRLGDPAFVDVDGVVADMLSKSYAAAQRALIKDDAVLPLADYGGEYEARDTAGTTHLSVMDAAGNVVALTSTVNMEFGSHLMYKGLVLNCEMDDFSSPNITNGFGLKPSPANFIAPGKRPLSSSTPLIYFDARDFPVFVAGASGGSRITSCTVQAFLNNILFGMNILEAISEPRLHDQLYPNELWIDEDYPEDIVDYLEGAGHNLVPLPSQAFAAVQGVAYNVKTEYLTGASDPRKGGRPMAVDTGGIVVN